MIDNIKFESRKTIEQVEESHELAPKFDENGLIPAITTSADTGEVLMLGYMNAEALKKTIITAQAHYYSRSRKILWHKGASSGLIQHVTELRIDDDQDAVWLKVKIGGDLGEASCHVGYRSCFYRSIPINTGTDNVTLQFTESQKTFDPVAVYGDVPNPTIL
jgi:phosphoribosyl-AMP cyclohydrolase